MTAELLVKILGGGATGVIATLVWIILAIIREDLTPGKATKRLEARLDRYESIAVKALETTERVSAMVDNTRAGRT